jgi:hypothetical protein
MSTIIVVAPLIIGGWPAITAAVTAAVASMGFAAVKEGLVAQKQLQQSKNREEIEVEDSEILQDAAGTGQEIVVEREGLRAKFSRDARGALRVCVEGEGFSKSELRRIGREMIDRVTQQYVYHRLMTELRDRNVTVVDEQVAEDRTVKIRVRNW